MAANLDWAMRTLYPGSRAVAWAHDVHVSHGGERARSFNAGAQMGAYLKHSHGHDYVAFSLLTRGGSYRATRSFSDHTMIEAGAFEAPASSVEGVLSTLPRVEGSVGVLVDLRMPENDPDGQWLWRPRPIRHIGFAAYDYGFDLLAVMPLEFDGVFLVERTSASQPLR
jgi:erythromycin esterase-like protein